MNVNEDLTPEQIAYLREHYPVDTNRSLSEHLHLTEYRVTRYAKQLDLAKDPETLSRRFSRNATMMRSHERVSRMGLDK